MYIFFILLIASAVLIYFSFKPSGDAQSDPVLVSEAIEDIAVGATVSDKTVETNPASRRGSLKYFIVFTLDDGSNLEFSVMPEIHGAINVGDRDTLVYHGDVFVGFGDIGAAEDSGEGETWQAGDGFTLDDYDESIDVEIPIGVEAPAADAFDEETRRYYGLFLSREKLPTKTETVTDETESFAGYSPVKLLEKTSIYPFLQREGEVRRMFISAYSNALTDLRGYEGNSRTGRAADSVRLRKNEIRVVITVQELPPPLICRIEAEFGVNE